MPVSWINAALIVRDAIQSDDPRSMLDGWSSVMAYLLIIFWVIKRMRLWMLAVHVRTYRSTDDLTLVHMHLDTINKVAMNRRAIAFGGSELLHRRRVPKFVVFLMGAKPYLVCNSVDSHLGGLNQHIEITVHVVAFRGSPPIILEPDAPTKDDVEFDVITVLEPGSNDVSDTCLESFEQTAIDSDIPANVAADATAVADVMASEFHASGCKAKVFVLMGRPGCGKSLAVRALTLRLNATLYSLYNPTRTGECIWRLLATYPTKKSPLVIAFEEFDVALANMMRGGVNETDKLRRDAIDKSSWNNLLDRFKRNKNVVLVMTTNRCDDELLNLVCLGDSSMLRPGRVDRRILFNNNDDDTAEDGAASFAGDSAESVTPPSALAAKGDTDCRPRWR
jgi:hypothetical protein